MLTDCSIKNHKYWLALLWLLGEKLYLRIPSYCWRASVRQHTILYNSGQKSQICQIKYWKHAQLVVFYFIWDTPPAMMSLKIAHGKRFVRVPEDLHYSSLVEADLSQYPSPRFVCLFVFVACIAHPKCCYTFVFIFLFLCCWTQRFVLVSWCCVSCHCFSYQCFVLCILQS